MLSLAFEQIKPKQQEDQQQQENIENLKSIPLGDV